MIINIEYKTHYTFSYQVPRLIQQIKLYPTDCNSQKILEWSITTLEGELMEAFTDSLGHKIHNIYITDSPKVQVITAKGRIKTTDTHGVIKDLNTQIKVMSSQGETPMKFALFVRKHEDAKRLMATASLKRGASQTRIIKEKFGDDVIIKKFEKQKSFLAKKLSSSIDNQIENLIDNLQERSLWQKFGL